MGTEGERMLGGLLEDSRLAAFEDLPALVAAHAAPAGLHFVTLYVADLQQRILIPLPGQRDGYGRPLEPIRIDGTLPGRAYRDFEVVQGRSPGEPLWPAPGQRVWAPLLEGTQRLGVLGATVDAGAAVGRVRDLAALVALLLMSKRAFSDSCARLSRTEPMVLSAEMTRTLMPPGVFATRDVVVAAVMEPAYQAGGDSYDYALDGSTLHLAVFDAMGHDTAAGLTSTIAIGVTRNAHRRGAGLTEVADLVDAAIAEQFTDVRFATGVLADLDVRSGRLDWINRGHPAPLVVRRGRRVAELQGPANMPMGLGLQSSPPPSGYQLEPGDRLLFYTDGIVEAVDPGGREVGLERFVDFIVRHEADGLSAPETLRRLVRTVLQGRDDRLRDDATVLIAEWRAGTETLLPR